MEKSLRKAFEKHHKVLLEAWFQQVIHSYPPESVKYFERYKETFNNPIGSNIYNSLNNILLEFEGAGRYEQFYQEMQMIMRIRAVQDMTPSKEVAFIMAFKDVVKKELAGELAHNEITSSELEDFFEELDALALMGFDIYTESRELIFKMRIDQIKETNDMLQKANLLNESIDISTFMRCSNYMDMENIQKEEKGE